MNIKEEDEEDTVFYQNVKHPNNVLVNLNSFREDEKLCDVTFICENHKVHAHRAVLAANSRYFTSMFCNGMLESTLTQVRIKAVDGDTFGALVNYCYTSNITISSNNVKTLYAAANHFDFPEVCDACDRFLLDKITVSNCVSLSKYAQKFSCKKLMEGADMFIRANFLKICRTNEFKELDVNHLLRIISHDELRVNSEIEVFKAVIDWVKFSLENRKSLFPTILENVRLGIISPKLLLDCVTTEPLVIEDPRCKALLDETTAYHLLPERRAELSSVRTRCRTCKPISIFGFGGENCEGEKLTSVERYCSIKKSWSSVSEMMVGRSSLGATSCNGELYVGGGFDGVQFLNSVEKYTPYTDQWKAVASLACPRSCMGMVCLGDFVYAIGGRLDDTRLATVERYDCHRDQWVPASRMTATRSAAGVTVVDGCIYVAGGYDGINDLNSVERYDPRVNKWCQVAPMMKGRSLTSAVTLNGLIYVPGGQILMTLLDVMECYDPRNNSWYQMAPLLSSRYGHGAAQINGKIYVAGGCDGSHRLNSVEVYDPIVNTWSVVGHMSVERHSLGVVAF